MEKAVQVHPALGGNRIQNIAFIPLSVVKLGLGMKQRNLYSWEYHGCRKSSERRGSLLTLMSFLFCLGRAGPSWFARPTGKYYLVDIISSILLKSSTAQELRLSGLLSSLATAEFP